MKTKLVYVWVVLLKKYFSWLISNDSPASPLVLFLDGLKGGVRPHETATRARIEYIGLLRLGG